MSLSPREKQLFFSQLEQLIRAGIPLSRAAEKLGKMSSSPMRTAARRLHKLLESDRTASEAFEDLGPHLDPLERTTLSALARAGRLDFGLQRLADYFGVMAKARLEMFSQSAYPVVMLHLGIILLNVTTLVSPGGGGLPAYLRETGFIFLLIYGAVALVSFLFPILVGLGAHSGLIDDILRGIPFLGKPRASLAVSRFLGTLDLQLDAGINVIESLNAAAAASRSGLIAALARRGARKIQKGQSLGEALTTVAGAIPADATDRIILAEETGDLHRTLPALQKEYEEQGLRQVRTAATWLPKLLYFAVLGYLGWRIVSFYMGYFKEVGKIIDSIGQ